MGTQGGGIVTHVSGFKYRQVNFFKKAVVTTQHIFGLPYTLKSAK